LEQEEDEEEINVDINAFRKKPLQRKKTTPLSQQHSSSQQKSTNNIIDLENPMTQNSSSGSDVVFIDVDEPMENQKKPNKNKKSLSKQNGKKTNNNNYNNSQSSQETFVSAGEIATASRLIPNLPEFQSTNEAVL